MSEPRPTMTFTQAVAELDESGFNSMGFAIEDGQIVCFDCDQPTTAEEAKVGGLLGYATDDGDGLVLVLRCPHCDVKGMLFAGPDVRRSKDNDIVETLAAKARG